MVNNIDSAEDINVLFHEYSEFIIGRMGLPYKKKGISIISVAIDAPLDRINSPAGRIGRIDGVTAKTLYS